jgi:hypothetical protein
MKGGEKQEVVVVIVGGAPRRLEFENGRGDEIW